MSDKPFSPSCERNREPILAVLRERLAGRRRVLEVGSGTGQHAAYFAAELPDLVWQASDRAENLEGIRAWLSEAQLPNAPPPLELDVQGAWPRETFDAVFTANTLHIMAWDEVECLFRQLPAAMAADALLVVYGPFNYGGRFTSQSNAAFEDWLKQRGAHMGIRDFEAVNALAQAAGMVLLEDREMPANNRCLVWRRMPH
jgi:SAM-dependent methyltransferase